RHVGTANEREAGPDARRVRREVLRAALMRSRAARLAAPLTASPGHSAPNEYQPIATRRRRGAPERERSEARDKLDVHFHPVIGEIEAGIGGQLGGAVRDEQPARARGAECVERLVEREVSARRAVVELAAEERRLAE